MKKIGYFVVGVFASIIGVFAKTTELGEIVVSNYNFYKEWNKKGGK